LAICERYEQLWGVRLDPETQAVTTIGAKEGLAHLLWTLVEPGDAALVPSPSYPIHIHAPILAGASVTSVPMGAGEDLFGNLVDAYERSRPRPRVVLLSFPHNPTTATVDLEFMQRVVDLAREREFVVVHDFAYAELGFDEQPPSILQADGAEDVAVELYSLTKGFSMAGWRVGFLVGNDEIVGALARLKSWLDYGTFSPIQIASVIALTEASDHPDDVREVYRSRRDALHTGLERIGWATPLPAATMFLWAPLPEAHAEQGSLEFALRLAREAHVAVSPGVGFGPGGEGFVRFALVENEQRIGQAVRGIRRFLEAA
jgi:alanine-synthesizing transaminase